jgi:hypothetical protein
MIVEKHGLPVMLTVREATPVNFLNSAHCYHFCIHAQCEETIVLYLYLDADAATQKEELAYETERNFRQGEVVTTQTTTAT